MQWNSQWLESKAANKIQESKLVFLKFGIVYFLLENLSNHLKISVDIFTIFLVFILLEISLQIICS